MSVRSDILDSFKEDLDEIPELEEVEINEVAPADLDDKPFPCSFVFSGPSVKVQRACIGFETWDWSVVVETWIQEDDPEEWIERLHKKLAEDYTRGGNSTESYLIDTDIITLNPTKELQSVVLIWRVRYSHKVGQP